MCSLLKRYKIRRMLKKIKSLQQARVHNQPSEEAVKKEIALYADLAKIYHKLIGKKKFPFAYEMVLECYRASSVLEDANAQYMLGKNLLEMAKFRDKLQQEGLFASASNERQAQQFYEEALAYLVAAENFGHVEAKRLHGLCYINGWGVAQDKKRGFDLVVASINDANSWDKVPQIFAEIGLNKPEFFSALAQHRNQA